MLQKINIESAGLAEMHLFVKATALDYFDEV